MIVFLKTRDNVHEQVETDRPIRIINTDNITQCIPVDLCDFTSTGGIREKEGMEVKFVDGSSLLTDKSGSDLYQILMGFDPKG